MKFSPHWQKSLDLGNRQVRYWSLDVLDHIDEMPYSIKILLENVLRNVNNKETALEYAGRIIEAVRNKEKGGELEFAPARVLFQDFTGVPVFVDLAAMRDAAASLGKDPRLVNPQIPCDLVIDHSVIADYAGCDCALAKNMSLEFSRNKERYAFLKWAQNSFENVRIVAPGQGICHQLNIEALADVVSCKRFDDHYYAYFDTVVGTDSHTPTANGLGILGWGVGGIEAEAACLGQPISIRVPQVIGVHLTGELQEGVSPMDLALHMAYTLRKIGVVGSFVECFGEGVSKLSATARSCVANMTPEYGSTCTLFPIDEQTLDYLHLSGRDSQTRELVEAYAKAQGLWHKPSQEKLYAQVIEIDLSEVKACCAGPSRPHAQIELKAAAKHICELCFERTGRLPNAHTEDVEILGTKCSLSDGALAIAAITSCTTATDPSMTLAAGLLARRAHERGLHSAPWVKTIFAPGSHAQADLLNKTGLIRDLEALGFYNCGFGCMSCIGNSGPIEPQLSALANKIELTSALSGNRNFEGRISPDVSQNYLMAPLWVIAYALAGTMCFDFETQALGKDKKGKDVFLRDIMPSNEEIQQLLEAFVVRDLFVKGNAALFEGDENWKAMSAPKSSLYNWDEHSSYVRKAPYFSQIEEEGSRFFESRGGRLSKISEASALVCLGDFVTTDHISPAGQIASNSEAAQYLRSLGVDESDFNTYGSRRGNHEVMVRGTFANVKLQNQLCTEQKGGYTRAFDCDAVGNILGRAQSITSVYDASLQARNASRNLVVVAQKMYGSGSSRDWAAKGPALLGVKAVLAQSFERIHRSNLIGMGIVPLEIQESLEDLALTGSESIDIPEIELGSNGMPINPHLSITITREDGVQLVIRGLARIDTPSEGLYLVHKGILPYVLKQLTGL